MLFRSDGKVASISAGETLVETAIGPIVCARKVAATPGAAATVCIRPEFIQVVTGGTGGGSNVFTGKVTSLVFVGEALEGEIMVGQTLLIFRIDPLTDLREGGEISLCFDPRQCSVLLN